MSIKKSLRIFLSLYTLLPVGIIFLLIHIFASIRFGEVRENIINKVTYSYAASLNSHLYMTSDSAFTSKEDLRDYITSYSDEYCISLNMMKDTAVIITDSSGYNYYSLLASKVDDVISPDLFASILAEADSSTHLKSGLLDSSYHNKAYLYAFSYIDYNGLVLITRMNANSFNVIRSMILPGLLISAVLLLPIAILLSSLLTRYYTKPIISLRNTMRIAAAGDLDVRSHLPVNNEIGDLAKHFNRMIGQIKQNYDELSLVHRKLLDNEDELKSNLNQIEFLAYHDILTSLPNKFSFHRYIEEILNASTLYTDMHAVYFIDLDNFKMINDTLGHEYGDLLLTQTAEKLVSLIEEKDCLARAGGDEFLLFTPYIKDAESAMKFAASIIEAFKHPFDLNGETAYIAMSIGIAMYPDNGLDSHILIKNADIAMYSSKEAGKNRCTLFNRTMEETIQQNAIILDILRGAIEREELSLAFQPQIHAKSGKLLKFEALARLSSQRLGPIPPSVFIPIAEESGIIHELGNHILRKACLFNKQLLDSGLPPMTVSVNISSVQLSHFGFFEQLSSILEETKLPPKYLELELTESALVSSIIDTTTIFERLQSIGVKVALDDFGTGYSSLSYLSQMPLDTLKIDKSFVDVIERYERGHAMIDTMIRIAHILDLSVVAEGVENDIQYKMLKELGCDFIQGYLFSRPLSHSEFVEFAHNCQS
ncbi:MAG: EAL domain-containing protein [Lachnospiraceae bacterium]|nr:EAL domain-containing protein [Lachnospiraceae bacterium]